MRNLSAFRRGRVSAARRSPGLLLLAALLLLTAVPLPSAEEARFFRLVGPAATTITAINPDGSITWTNAATNVTCTVQTAVSLVGPSNWVDYVQVPVSNHVITHRLFDPNPPAGMAFIPAGSFTMGNCMDTNEGSSDELPLHTVYVSAFCVDKHEVAKALWDEVKVWNGGNGYSYNYAGSSKAADRPILMICWYDVVKWCNARSQKEGLTPCYYTDAGLTTIYKTGQAYPYVKWNGNGYRLPTEAEWEKAARGGASGHRFPWSDVDTITHSRANYFSTNSYTYDTSPTRGYHPTFNDGVSPYTSPVGCFAANGYGLYDMAGNVWEWCWDWHGAYSSGSQSDPHGPSTPGSFRIMRGGGWSTDAAGTRCANRSGNVPHGANPTIGFRCVREP